MGKKKSADKEKKEEEEEDKEEEPEEEEEESEKSKKSKKKKASSKKDTYDNEKKTHLGDTANMKRLLDDAVIDVLLDGDEENYIGGFVEDTSLSNLKLLIGFSAVGASLVSHVYPAPFPRNWWCLLFCCTFYFVMSGVLQLLLSFVELESILLLRGKKDGPKSNVYGLNISSHFPRFQEIYTLGITPLYGSAMTSLASSPKFRPDVAEGNSSPYCLQRSWKVEKFFDEDGSFAEEDFMKSVNDFVQEYTQLLTTADGLPTKKAQ